MAAKKAKKSSKKEDEKMKGQIWSVDVIIGIVIFISIITVFYSTVYDKTEENNDALKENADSVIVKFTQDPSLRVIGKENLLNITKLENLSSEYTYDELKTLLGIEGDFCIYVEDEEGRIVPINGRTSIGKGDINISNKPCGSPV